MSSKGADRPRARRVALPAGFTLIELMVALTVGGIVIGSMYAMGATSTRTFQVQHQIASMQSSLRFAYVQLKRDIMRAGFHAVPNASAPNSNVCNPIALPVGLPGGPGWYAGISSFRDNVPPNVVDPTDSGLNPPGVAPARGFSRDEVTLIGNYATSNQYPNLQVINGTVVSLSTIPGEASHSLQVDFGWDPNTGRPTTVINAAEVLRAFPRDGLIRIGTRSGRHHFATLTAAPVITATAITFTFFPPLGACQAEANDGWIAPLSAVRFDVALTAADTWDTDRTTGAVFAQLRRTRLQAPNMTTVLGGGPLLDYTATFNLEFTMNTPNPLPLVPDNYRIGQRATAVEVNANPESVRSVEVELGVRAPDTDPALTFPCPDQGCMAIFPNSVVGSPAARVRVLRSEVFLPNIAYEGR